MTDCTSFIEAADQHTGQWSGLIRVPADEPGHVQQIQFVANSEQFETQGAVIFAVASGANDLSHVAMSIHAFVDGQRVAPVVSQLGDELIITVENA